MMRLAVIGIRVAWIVGSIGAILILALRAFAARICANNLTHAAPRTQNLRTQLLRWVSWMPCGPRRQSTRSRESAERSSAKSGTSRASSPVSARIWLCYTIPAIDELIYDRPLNPVEAAMVTALLRAARQFRALSPQSNYRTVYEVVVNNLVVGSFKIKGSEVPIRE